jgi:ferredoxin
MGIRIALNRDKCQGHGLCVMHAPETFVIDPDTGVAEILPDGALRSSRESLELAEQMCPVNAIRILAEEEDGEEARAAAVRERIGRSVSS